MAKTKKIVIANWKMNPDSLLKVRKLFQLTKKFSLGLSKTRVVVCPPAIYLASFNSKTKNINLGAQDVFWQVSGAHTGEISSAMLKNLGVSYCLAGHSERRTLGETDEEVSKKLKALLKSGLTPILCVGERERDSQGEYLGILSNQIKSSLSGVDRRDIKNLIVAYEPIWAIGRTAREAINSHKLHQTVLFIEKILSELYGREQAKKVAIVYGGSVEVKNASEIIKNGNVSGFLVGHASLDPLTFREILLAVDNS